MTVELTVKMVKKSRETALKASSDRRSIFNTSCRQFSSVCVSSTRSEEEVLDKRL